MIKLFTHENRLIVFNLKNLLQQQGIETQVRNEYSAGAAGDLAPHEVWPELWLIDEQHETTARALVAELTTPTQKDWTCPQCGEQLSAAYDYCWQCQTQHPGLV